MSYFRKGLASLDSVSGKGLKCYRPVVKWFRLSNKTGISTIFISILYTDLQ